MRVSSRIAALLSMCLLATPAAVLTAPAAVAEEVAQTQVSITWDKQRLRFRDTFTLQGQVTTSLSDGETYYVDSAPVSLQRRFPGKPWRTISSTTSSSYDGTYRFAAVTALQNAGYRVRYHGETRSDESGELTLAASTSQVRAIKVERAFRLSSVRRNGGIVFKGRVLPKYQGKVVQIQRRRCSTCAWKGWTKVRTNKRSRFAVRVALPSRGTWDYRARTPKSPPFVASTSDKYLSVWRS
ncbi:MAG TPA: hypothetical protein VK964_09870 [Nocardioidaceae bacterium]|nr:hypothetical protein [Nocardioidaceae bacterium]